MATYKIKRKNRSMISRHQSRLLRDSLSCLLGPGLGIATPLQSEKAPKVNFLKEMINAKVLDRDWIS
jgi:hypothetical protein